MKGAWGWGVGVVDGGVACRTKETVLKQETKLSRCTLSRGLVSLEARATRTRGGVVCGKGVGGMGVGVGDPELSRS